MVSDEPGRIFREAWIAGVKRHYPGEPKPGYVTPWEETPDWERQSATAVYEQVHQFIDVSSGTTSKLSREQKGRFVALCWIAQGLRRRWRAHLSRWLFGSYDWRLRKTERKTVRKTVFSTVFR